MHFASPRILASINVDLSAEHLDRLHWTKSHSGQVTTKHFIEVAFTPGPILPKFDLIWKSWLPLKVSCFLWKCLKAAIATDDRVKALDIPFPSKCVCCTCPKEESTDHLLFRSDLVSILWDFVCPIFRNRRPSSIHEFLYDWGISRNFRKFQDCLAFGISACVLWEVWKCRNDRRYEDRGTRINRTSICRLAGLISRSIPAPCIFDANTRNICNRLLIVAPLARDFKVEWRRWEPVGGVNCNLSILTNEVASAMAAIMRDRCGRFLFAMKMISTPKTFLKCFLQIMAELKIKGFNISSVKCSSMDIALIGHQSEVQWQDFQIKRTAARMCNNMKIFKVCPALNIAADFLCGANVGLLSTASLDNLPGEVQEAIHNDFYDRPCSFLDQRIFV